MLDIRFNLTCFVVCVKQKTEYYMRIRDWSSDVCSSVLFQARRQYGRGGRAVGGDVQGGQVAAVVAVVPGRAVLLGAVGIVVAARRAGRHGLAVLQTGRASCRERVCQYV